MTALLDAMTERFVPKAKAAAACKPCTYAPGTCGPGNTGTRICCWSGASCRYMCGCAL
ncbi:hypothetical protein [Actinorhabdospora filicis]|nr:hypothetical protein [Actinorhabdospora filicis]